MRTSLLKLVTSLLADCFSGRLFLVVVFIGVFLADFGFGFDYEVIAFLADCALSECINISNLIFFELLLLSCSVNAVFCGLSGATLAGR